MMTSSTKVERKDTLQREKDERSNPQAASPSRSSTEEEQEEHTTTQQQLTSDPSSWHRSSLLSVTQLTNGGLNLLHETALSMRALVQNNGGDSRLSHKVLATVFYEPSTRTFASFQCAMHRLGGKVLNIDASSSSQSSSTKKGETLEDTIRCVHCYTDVVVLRHPVKGSVSRAANAAGGFGSAGSKPLINAGDGVGEHPTQALLDLFTIRDEVGEEELRLKVRNGEPLTVVMLGDLKHGRTVHSLAKLLAQWSSYSSSVADGGDGDGDGAGAGAAGVGVPSIRLVYCSPPSLRMPEYVKEYVSNSHNEHFSSSSRSCGVVEQVEVENIDEVIGDADVLYVTRVQKERFENEADYETIKGAYVVDEKLMLEAKSSMVLMHPLPRVDEIHTNVDSDNRAAYFRQMENGMYVRMAILALLLGKGSSVETSS